MRSSAAAIVCITTSRLPGGCSPLYPARRSSASIGGALHLRHRSAACTHGSVPNLLSQTPAAAKNKQTNKKQKKQKTGRDGAMEFTQELRDHSGEWKGDTTEEKKKKSRNVWVFFV